MIHSLLGKRFFMTLLLCLGLVVFAPEAQANKKYASIVMDADTGLILHQRHADKRLHPASLTKIMTLLMVFDAIESGKISYNTRIRMSRHAASMVPSKIGLPAGASIKVRDAIYALVTKSANDVAVALAEDLGGTERNFARMMTKRARSIGMSRTTFRNASGLHHKSQISTARDMAVLAQYVIQAYPTQYRYFSRKNFTYRGKTYRNHNKLLGTYRGMDGMKTGYISAAGFNLVASAVRNNRRIIGVVFGGRSGKTRNAHMAKLLDKGFKRVNDIRIASAKVPLPPRKPGVILAMAALRDGLAPQVLDPVSKHAQAVNKRMADMGQLIGEGDFDIHKIKRIETGMLAIAAHTGREMKRLPRVSAPAKIEPRAGNVADWSIQIGAFASRAATDQLLLKSKDRLPKAYSNVSPVIAPLKTRNGWLFRGRLAGLTEQEAHAACTHFKECLAIAPSR